MNKWILSLLLVLLQLHGFAQTETPEEQAIAAIVKRIQLPSIPAFSINVKSLGAKGNGAGDSKPAFDKAMLSCKKKGGGTIVVPAGLYLLKGPLHLVSNIRLQLDRGATLRFSAEPEHYLPAVLTSWEGTMLYNYSPFIYANNAQNIAITGEGTIDGAAADTWNKWKALEKTDKELSRRMNHDETPVDQRMFGKGHYLRPQLIQFVNCKNILVEGVRIENSPFWCLHLLKSSSATIRKLKYHAMNKNNDGIDPEYSKDILIEDIDFDNADDNVAIKAGRDHEGRKTGITSKNIVIRNCRFKGLHGVVIGSEMSAGVQNVFVTNCTTSGYLKRGIYLKTNADRGGFIRNIFVNKVSFDEVEDCFFITADYMGEGKGHASKISDIHLSNISCNKATGTALVVQGYPTEKIEGLTLKNIIIKEARNSMTITNAAGVDVSEIIIGEKAGVPSSAK